MRNSSVGRGGLFCGPNCGFIEKKNLSVCSAVVEGVLKEYDVTTSKSSLRFLPFVLFEHWGNKYISN